ncbi:PREDICTED: peroxisome assembly protein 26 isoform X1 [Crocodylus porosus]|uniref:peroxisome assembly protein 26 isoform X1 n=2 Tax=Crocodylus porosus TaxID=8502 RepID=UPI00093A6416|nr:PREDICTED: peroxisome assembly protein 26 isoform X1 [Crocodylus porosus]
MKVSAGPAPGAAAAALLEEAADLLVVHVDFAASLDACERGCDLLAGRPGSEEVKCSLCIVGIQALSEMNRWREVLSWVLRYYHTPEHLPPKILELCILLYSRVREPHVMLEVGNEWLRDLTNKSLPSYGTVMELYLLHVLLPLGQFAEAEELAQSCEVFDKEQQLLTLSTIHERKHQWVHHEEMQSTPREQPVTVRQRALGSLPEKFLSMLKLLHRVLRFMSSHFCFISYKKMLLAAFMLYLVVVRLDPGMGLRLQHVTCHLLWLRIKNQKLLEMGFIHASLIRIWCISGGYVAALSYPQFLSELLQ